MSLEIIVSGMKKGELIARLEAYLLEARPEVIGIASAFISVMGLDRMLGVVERCGSPKCRLVAGIDHQITHPEALNAARQAGWSVRLGHSSFGVFHPKLIVAGERFDAQGSVINPSFAYIGSGNLTEAALMYNMECATVIREEESAQAAANAFCTFWHQAIPANSETLAQYSSRFARRNRQRDLTELEVLGVSDSRRLRKFTPKFLRTQNPPPRATVSETYAEAAWTGVQSFTGEFTFQVEFPRLAGEVLARLIASDTSPGDYVTILCNDNLDRQMKYSFYEDNSMFRLNVPNDVPGVEWARQHKEGIAVVRRRSRSGPISLEIYRPGTSLNAIVARSVALGTWGKTSTRLYGWF